MVSWFKWLLGLGLAPISSRELADQITSAKIRLHNKLLKLALKLSGNSPNITSGILETRLAPLKANWKCMVTLFTFP